MTSGNIVKDKIIIEKPKDASRLYNKSIFGRPLSGDKLELDLVEGVFLLSENKLKIYENKKEIKFQKLVEKATKKIPDFEIKYLVYKDLRKRGLTVKMYDKEENFTFYQCKKNPEKDFFVTVFSENNILSLNETVKLVNLAVKNKKELWFSIVDDEGDITYYNVSNIDLRGNSKKHIFSKGKGVLLDNRVIVFDEKLAKNLFEREFYGKFFESALQLSFVESLFLLENKVIEILSLNGKKISKNDFLKVAKKIQPDIDLRLLVFKDLKNRGLIVKTGFKFGSHFRVYTRSPDDIHAEYLVHVVDKDYEAVWSEFSRAVRLAHSVNKEIVFAKAGKNIEYIRFGRLRP